MNIEGRVYRQSNTRGSANFTGILLTCLGLLLMAGLFYAEFRQGARLRETFRHRVERKAKDYYNNVLWIEKHGADFDAFDKIHPEQDDYWLYKYVRDKYGPLKAFRIVSSRVIGDEAVEVRVKAVHQRGTGYELFRLMQLGDGEPIILVRRDEPEPELDPELKRIFEGL